MLHAGATVKSLGKGEDQTRKGCPAVIPGPVGHFHVLGIALEGQPWKVPTGGFWE
jgi:hypothetical protein